MDDLSSKFLEQIIEKEEDPFNWRNYDIETTEIHQENLNHISEIQVFKEEFPKYSTPALETYNEDLMIPAACVLIVLLTVGYIIRICRYPWKRSNPETKQTKDVVKSLPEALKRLEVVSSTSKIIEFGSSNSILQLTITVDGLSSYLVDKYSQLETAEACESVMSHIDSLNLKISRSLDQYITNFHRNGPVPSAASRQAFQMSRMNIDRIKECLTEIRNDLSKVLYLDETRYKWKTYQNMKEAMAAADINSVLDYNKLMYEYKDTQHYLYPESIAFIDEYYRKETERLEHSASGILEDNLSSISEAFKRMAIEENESNEDDLPRSKKTLTNGDVNSPDSSASLPTDVASSSSASGSADSASSVPLTVDVSPKNGGGVVINAPVMMSPQVRSTFLIESERIKREAKEQLNAKLEKLRSDRKENESRAVKWAKQLVEERTRDITASRLMLEQMREQRVARREQSRAEEEVQHRQLMAELATEKALQQRLDRQWFMWLAAVSAIVYIAVYSEWDPDRAGNGSWGRWLMQNVRRTCSLVECRVRDDPATNPSVLNSVLWNSAAGTGDPLYLAPFNLHNGTTTDLSQRAVAVVNSVVTFSPLNYVVTSLVPSSVGSMLGVDSGEVLWGYGKCAGYFAVRSIVPWIAGRVNAFFRLPSIAVLLVFLYCFSDLLLRMVGGPLQPLLYLGVGQFVLYLILSALDHRTTWMVYTIDARPMMVYIVYPLLLILITATVSCVHNMEQKTQTSFTYSDICVGCIRHSLHSLYVVLVGGILTKVWK